jgi:two-component system response regulator FixJ
MMTASRAQYYIEGRSIGQLRPGFDANQSAAGYFRAFILLAGNRFAPAKVKAMQKAIPGANSNAVVVVDDNYAVRNSLKFSLEVEGFPVRTFACGGDPLGSSLPHRYACLVVDQNLPGMSGLDLIARLRTRNISAPAILTTTNPSATLIERAKRAGVHIVEKPLLGNVLVDEIREICVQLVESQDEAY